MAAKEGKIIIISAPSGCGKSTIINAIIGNSDIDLQFSISATSRKPRGEEQHGIHYYFLSEEEFRSRISNNEFVEYEEVYPGRFYGTLRSEVARICGEGHNVVLDIDVKGGINVKRQYGDRARSIFIQPPSIDELRRRLEGRATDAPEVIDERVAKADFEISYAPQYDFCVINDDLSQAIDETRRIILDFINQ